MKPSKNPKGYLITTVMINGKRFSIPIHIAVARTFLDDRTSEGLQVNHKDGNKENNNVNNLEWVTAKENMQHSVNVLGQHIGANSGNARSINGYDKKTGELKHSFDSISDGAKFFCEENEDYRIKETSLWRALSGYRKSYKNCIWKYAN
jgi:hypothetical protein